jgi:hypothetical protein
MNRNEPSAVRQSCCSLLLGLVVFIVLPTADAFGQSFIGTPCWNLTITDTTVTGMVIPTTLVLKSDISSMGGSSYTLIGHVTVSGDNPFTLSGFGHVIGGTLYLDMSGSQSHATGGWRDSSAVHAAINMSTLSGTFYDIGNDFNAVTRQTDSTRYSAGTIALAAACP